MGPLALLTITVACYDAPVEVPLPPDLPLPSLGGRCDRYAYLAMPGLSLRQAAAEDCETCGWIRITNPDASGFREVREGDGEETSVHSWMCSKEEVRLRQVRYGEDDDTDDVDVFDPPVVRWVVGTTVGGGWTSEYRRTQIRDGAVVEVANRTRVYTVEAEETLTLPGGHTLPALRILEEKTGELRWISEGYGLVRKTTDEGTSALTDVVWPAATR